MTRFSARTTGIRLVSNQRGAITLTFTMLLPFLLALIAVALFFAMYSQVVARAGQASDAASVTCAFQQRGSTDVIQGYLDYYRPVFVPEALLAGHQIDAKQGCQIAAQYRFAPLMTELLPVSVDGNAQVQSGSSSSSRLLTSISSNPTDFSLVLDISGSMAGRLPELQQIITDVIDDIDPRNNQVRFSIVPFGTGVSIKDAPWYPSSMGTAKCVDGLSYSGGSWDEDKTVDDLDSPASGLSISDVTPGPWLDRCSPDATILPLTDDFSLLSNYVARLTASGGSTASYQGLIWGVRTLTMQWQQEWEVSKVQPVATKQRLVLFTDGADSNRDYLNRLINAGLCQAIQQDHGIEMSFIGFGVSSDRLEQFRRCAGSSGVVYDSRDTAELETYFRSALKVETENRIVLGE